MVKISANGASASKTKQAEAKSVSSNGKKDTPAKSATDKKQKTLEDLFEEELKDMYSAEKQLLEALPKMAEAAHSEDLKHAFTKHYQQTHRHVGRIEKIFDLLRVPHEEETCLAMKGLIQENTKLINEIEEGFVRDSALIIGAQKVEHYEIASYGSLCELADVLGHAKIVDILYRTQQEEENTDSDLTAIAQDVNDEAYEASLEEEPEEAY